MDSDDERDGEDDGKDDVILSLSLSLSSVLLPSVRFVSEKSSGETALKRDVNGAKRP